MVKNRPKLLIHTPFWGKEYGGVGASARRIFSGLHKYFDLIVLIPSDQLNQFTCEEDNEFIYYSTRGKSEHKDQFLTDLIIELNRKHKIDILGNFYLGGWSYSLALAAQMSHIPLVHFGRGNDIDLGFFASHKFELSYCLERAKRIYAVSKEMRDKIIQIIPTAKTEYIANSINVKDYPFEFSEMIKPLTFGLFGHIKRKKGLEVILPFINFEAGERLIIQGDLYPEQARFLHGYLSLHPEFVSQIIQLPYEKDHEAYIRNFRKIDILCLPSLHDGMPNTMLEAMSLGKLVLGANIGGIKDVVVHGENGFLFNPWDEENLISILEEVRCIDINNFKSIIYNARQTIEDRFYLKKEAKRYARSLYSLIKRDFDKEYQDH